MVFYALADGMEQARLDFESSLDVDQANLLTTIRWYQAVVVGRTLDINSQFFDVIEDAYAFYIARSKMGDCCTLATITPGVQWKVTRFNRRSQ